MIAIAPFLALALLAAPAAADNTPNLSPATQASILTGVQACLGSTLEPDPRPARFDGWTAATSEQRKDMNAGGQVVMRDNVLIAFKPGKDGGCVVMARSDDGFDKAAFYTKLGTTVGAPVPAADKPEPVTLPDGEMLIPVITARPAEPAPDIILVFANAAGKYAKKEN